MSYRKKYIPVHISTVLPLILIYQVWPVRITVPTANTVYSTGVRFSSRRHDMASDKPYRYYLVVGRVDPLKWIDQLIESRQICCLGVLCPCPSPDESTYLCSVRQ
jgi:hypothetical protein